MCPQIVKDTVDGILQDPDFRDVFNMIRSQIKMSGAKLIKKFKNMKLGKILYIIRCLEMKGLI